MRILLLTRFYLNGQNTHVLSLANQLKRKRLFVYLIASYLDNPAYISWLKRNGIPFSRSADVLKLESHLRKYNFDIIHTHSAHTLEPALELGEKWGVPVVATSHYLDFCYLNSLGKTDHIIAISEEMKNLLNQKLGVKVPVTVVENGVEIFPYRKVRKEPRIITCLTRMSNQKEPNFELFCETALKQGFKVYSVGNWRPQNSNITSSNWVSNTRPILANSDIVVGTGRTVREAMAAGCVPIVLGDFWDGSVNEENVEELRAFNFSGRKSKQEPTMELITNELERLRNGNFIYQSRFCHEYAKQNFAISRIATETILVYNKLL